ncbi:hypothetical protein I6E74_03450 [Salinibacterium sp. SWN139]|uniref:hypothetical protein n=1 Tax=Salinibacterium sp. SWN139 TaxID=2792055 RepID=UPI0018CFA3F1|nr:hypothetical protein [Salinibacterium sp. SWN139]MBH0053222.1 hypothetical protein [Salinibacterium sp. SWN139]
MAIIRYTGIYNADGGVWGETRYVIGHMLGTAACSLCDITHSPIRRKPEWDAMVRRLGVPLEVRHRNEITEAETAFVATVELPVVLAHHDDGRISTALRNHELEAASGSVSAFESALTRSAVLA